MAQTSEYGKCCELQERLDEMDGNPATVWFLWMVTERTERKKKRGKEKLHSLKGDKDTYMEMELPKTSKQAWKHYSKKELHTTDTYGKIVFFFFKAPMTRRYFKELLLPLHSLPPFPKHDKQMKEPSEGRCRLGSPLSFYLPSPHTSLLRSSPTTWLKSSPDLGLLWTEPQSSHVVRDQTCL